MQTFLLKSSGRFEEWKKVEGRKQPPFYCAEKADTGRAAGFITFEPGEESSEFAD